jgi:hypothetical protein
MPPRLTVITTPPDALPDSWSERQTESFTEAFSCGFYMVLERSRDGEDHVVRMLYGGNRLPKALAIFAERVRARPRGHWTVQQGARVIEKWPND